MHVCLKQRPFTGTCSNISFFHHFFHNIYDYTIKGVIDKKIEI